MQSWLIQGSSDDMVTLLPGTTFIHVHIPFTEYDIKCFTVSIYFLRNYIEIFDVIYLYISMRISLQAFQILYAVK